MAARVSKQNKEGDRYEGIKYSSVKKMWHLRKPSISCGRLRDGWGDWKWSLSWRLFWWEQQPWQMGQLNHCGNGVLDGWLWISGGHRVAVSHVSELSEEFSIQGFETPSSQAQDTDKKRELWSLSIWAMRPKIVFQVYFKSLNSERNRESWLSVKDKRLEKGWMPTKDNNFACTVIKRQNKKHKKGGKKVIQQKTKVKKTPSVL